MSSFLSRGNIIVKSRRKRLSLYLGWGAIIVVLVLVSFFHSAVVFSSRRNLGLMLHHPHDVLAAKKMNHAGDSKIKYSARFDILEDVGVSEYSLGSIYTKEILKFFNQTLVRTRSTWEKDVLNLNGACPVILSGRHQKSGLGHAFMSFNTLVAIASFYRLTLNATFPEKLSHSPDLLEVAKFFNGDVFRSRFANVNCAHRFDANAHTMPKTVEKARSLCAVGRPICINITEEVPPAEVLVDMVNYRRNFAIPEGTAAALRKIPYFQSENEHLRVVIHMRRGDVVNRTRYAGRWISNQAYLDFIPQLLTRVKAELPVAVIVFAEGAKSIGEIPDVLPPQTHDFSKLHENVTLGPSEMHLTLASFCNADILVTSPSGFSQLAALLCEKPHILGLPFWQSHATLPNTLTELFASRDETGAIVKLELPGSFHFERKRMY
jgi:hypothetical protein